MFLVPFRQMELDCHDSSYINHYIDEVWTWDPLVWMTWYRNVDSFCLFWLLFFIVSSSECSNVGYHFLFQTESLLHRPAIERCVWDRLDWNDHSVETDCSFNTSELAPSFTQRVTILARYHRVEIGPIKPTLAHPLDSLVTDLKLDRADPISREDQWTGDSLQPTDRIQIWFLRYALEVWTLIMITQPVIAVREKTLRSN